jgi:hypothetical protein
MKDDGDGSGKADKGSFGARMAKLRGMKKRGKKRGKGRKRAR